MIKNQKQASITLKKVNGLKDAKENFITEWGNKPKDFEYQLSLISFNELIKDLDNELNEYKSLIEGYFNCLHPSSLSDIPELLIKARLAQNISQKKLSTILGIKEQQVQRYEKTDFEGVSLNKLIEFSEALEIRFYFEKVLLIKSHPVNKFNYPNELDKNDIEKGKEKIKNGAFLIMQ